MTKVHAYLARIKEQEKEVIAVPDGAGRALCVSSDKHWTLTREWSELHIIAPLVEDEGNDDLMDQVKSEQGQNERLRKALAGSRDAHRRTVEAHETMKRAFDLSQERVLELKLELNATIEERNEWKARAEQAEVEEPKDPIDSRTNELLNLAYPDVPKGIKLPDSVRDTCRLIAEAEARLEARDA